MSRDMLAVLLLALASSILLSIMGRISCRDISSYRFLENSSRFFTISPQRFASELIIFKLSTEKYELMGVIAVGVIDEPMENQKAKERTRHPLDDFIEFY